MTKFYKEILIKDEKPNKGWVLTPQGGFLYDGINFKCCHSGEIQDKHTITSWLKKDSELINMISELISEITWENTFFHKKIKAKNLIQQCTEEKE